MPRFSAGYDTAVATLNQQKMPAAIPVGALNFPSVSTVGVLEMMMALANYSFSSPGMQSRASEPTLERVTVGFCSNMLLRGFAQLQRRAAPKSATELGCELLFAASTISDADSNAFARNVARRPGAHISTTSTDWVATMSVACETDSQTAEIWRLLGGERRQQSQVESRIELVGSSAVPSYYASSTSATIRPVVLAGHATFSDARALRVESVQGSAGWVLAAGGVRAVFEIYKSAGQSLYACVHGEEQQKSTQDATVECGARVPEPLISETLAEFADRVLLSPSSSPPPRVTLVYCAVDCAHHNWRKFCGGISTESLVETYAALVRNNAINTLADPHAVSIERWQFVRLLLPLVHADVWPAFRASITGAMPSRSPFALLDGGGGDVSAPHFLLLRST